MTVEFNTITMMKKLINIQSLLWLVVVSFFIVSCCKQEPIDTPEPINEIKLSQKLQANDGLASDYFGSSVAISGDYAIVGAFSDTVGGNQDKGSAYIFQYSGSSWSQQAKLIPSDGMIDDHFGYSVSISGDYAIVGTGESDINWTNKGSAYIFHRTGNIWVQQVKLLADDGMEGDQFGNSVSISGDYAIVGAYHDDVERNLYQGSAYIFHRAGDSWSLQAKLTASDGRRDDHFGYSVSISGDYAIVGAVFDNVGGITGKARRIFSTVTGALGSSRFSSRLAMGGLVINLAIPYRYRGIMPSSGLIMMVLGGTTRDIKAVRHMFSTIAGALGRSKRG